MRSIIITVLIFKLVNSAFVNFSENDKLQSAENDRSNFGNLDRYLGSPKTSRKTSLFARRDVYNDIQKKKCDTCREMKRCKVQGKCELCARFCRSLEITTQLPPTDMPILGNMQAYPENDEQPTTESTPNAIILKEKSGRYYTLGAFGPGPRQNLITKLLHLKKKENLDKVLILAKAKGKNNSYNSKPVIIDAASVFKINNDSKEINAEIYPINASIQPIDMDLVSRIERELDMAIQQKKKLLGSSYLTQEEVDKVIDHALSLFNHRLFFPPTKLTKNVPNLQSRNNIAETSHLTTKRSILPFWKITVSTKEETDADKNDTILSASDPEFRKNFPSQKNNHTLDNQAQNSNNILENKPFSKKSFKKSQNINLGKNNLKYMQNEKNNFKNGPYLSEDECTEDDRSAVDENDSNNVSGEVLVEYEPRPPKKTEDNDNSFRVRQADNFVKNRYSPSLSHIIPDIPLDKNIPEIISIPVNNYEKLESADQRIDTTASIFRQSENIENRKPEGELRNSSDSEDKDSSEILQAVMESPQNKFDSTEFDSEITETNTNKNTTSKLLQLNDTGINYVSNENVHVNMNNLSDPVVGMSLPLNESDSSLSQSVSPGNFNENEITTNHQDEFQNDRDRLEFSESKTNFINASLFTLILKNLEKKVENIADLVKKTCGKTRPDSEKYEKVVAHKNPTVDISEELSEETPVTKTENIKKYTSEPVLIHSRLADVPANQLKILILPATTTHFETVSPSSQTELIETIPSKAKAVAPTLVNVVADQVQRGQKIMLDRAFNVADLIQGGLGKPKPIDTSDNQRLQATKPDNMNRGLFEQTGITHSSIKQQSTETAKKSETSTGANQQDPTIGCSKEDSEEYVGDTKGEETKDTPSSKLNEFRSGAGFEEGTVTTSALMDSRGVENVGCSKEDSNEYTGEKRIETDESTPKLNESTTRIQKGRTSNENVGCSEESNEYVGQQDKQQDSKPVINDVQSENKLSPNVNDSTEVLQENSNNEELRILNQNETPVKDLKEDKVGCSKEDSEEYVGNEEEKPNNLISKNNEEVVAFSKEEEDHPTYSSYERKASPDNDKDSLRSLNFVKHKPLLPISNVNPTHFPLRPNEIPSITPTILKENSNADFSISPANLNYDVTTANNKDVTDLPTTVGEVLQQPMQQKLPVPQYLNPEHEKPITSQSNKVSLLQPSFEQRFGEDQETSTIGEGDTDSISAHRLKNLQNWSKLPNSTPLVGAEVQDDNQESAAITSTYTQNPFSIFGRVVPQLNNTEISFHRIPSNKVYFVGTGMQLPLNMKKHADGSYQLSVDVEKLCNTCSEDLCKKKSKKQPTESKNNVERSLEDEDATSGIKSSSKNDEIDLEQSSTNIKTISESEILGQNEFRQLKPQRIEIVAMETPIFRNRRIPALLKRSDRQEPLGEYQSSKLTSNKSKIRALNFATNEKKLRFKKHKESKHQQLIDVDVNNGRKQSDLSKRSANAQLIKSPLHNRIQKSLIFKNLKDESSFSDADKDIYSGNADNSLNKLDTNMGTYFDQRQKLDTHFRNEHDVEHTDDTKDLVKRRVTLVNNVLTWMKSIAVENAHIN